MEKNKTYSEQFKIEGFKAIHNLSVLAIKSLLLANGGAILSILTFLGGIIKEILKVPDKISCAVASYLIGFGMALACSLVAYLFQVVEVETTRRKLSAWLRIIAILLGIMSFAFFVCGAVSSVDALKELSANVRPR